MRVYVTHPDNAKWLKAELRKKFGKDRRLFDINNPFAIDVSYPPFQIKESAYINRDTLTGRYVLQSGEIVKRENIRIVSRFHEYGPEDLELLLFAGLVQEERTRLFYEVDSADAGFRINAGVRNSMPNYYSPTPSVKFSF